MNKYSSIKNNVQSENDTQFKISDADSYNNVADYFDRYTERFTRHMLAPMSELAGIRPNHRVLDIGTGTGVVALDVAGKLEQEGKIIGVDLSDGMLAMAKEKAEKTGLSGRTQFSKMDAEALEFREGSFDSVLSLYALRHFPNPEKAVQEMYRVLKTGGHVVIATGSRPSLFSGDGVAAVFRKLSSIIRMTMGRELVACDFIDSLVTRLIPESELPETAEWTDHKHKFTGSIKSLLEAAGFRHETTTWQGQYSIIDSPEDFWLLQMTFSSLARKRIGQADDSAVEELKREFFAKCNEVLSRQGRLVYQSGAAIVSAVKTN